MRTVRVIKVKPDVNVFLFDAKDVPGLEDVIRSGLHQHYRAWSRAHGGWVLTDTGASIILKMLAGYDDVIVDWAATPTSPPSISIDGYLSMVHLDTSAPDWLVKIVHRAWMARLHPDNQETGDVERFKVLMTTHEQYEKEHRP